MSGRNADDTQFTEKEFNLEIAKAHILPSFDPQCVASISESIKYVESITAPEKRKELYKHVKKLYDNEDKRSHLQQSFRELQYHSKEMQEAPLLWELENIKDTRRSSEQRKQCEKSLNIILTEYAGKEQIEMLEDNMEDIRSAYKEGDSTSREIVSLLLEKHGLDEGAQVTSKWQIEMLNEAVDNFKTERRPVEDMKKIFTEVLKDRVVDGMDPKKIAKHVGSYLREQGPGIEKTRFQAASDVFQSFCKKVGIKTERMKAHDAIANLREKPQPIASATTGAAGKAVKKGGENVARR